MIEETKSESEKAGKPYHAPVFITYGQVKDIIRTNQPGPHDDNSNGLAAGEDLRSV